MVEYQGQPCIICGKVFQAGDDIVSCPDCGTPYHRACYQKAGACINTALHESGGSWVTERRKSAAQERSAEKRAEQDEQAAERERGEAPQMINASLYDGVRLNPNDPCVGLDPSEDMDGAQMGDLAEFVATNRFYYLPLFRLMKKTGKKFSFNLICLFFPQLYFANRKMWGMTFVSMLLDMLFSIPQLLLYFYEQMEITIPWADVTTVSFQRIYNASMLIGMVLSVFWCLFANHMYYRFAVRNVKRIRKAAVSEGTMHDQLQTAGGTSAWNVVLALICQAAIAGAFSMMLVMLR